MTEFVAFSPSRREVIALGAASAAVTSLPANAQSASSLSKSPSTMQVFFEINGKPTGLNLDTRTTLLDALREHLKLTGTKKGCDHGQ